MLQVLSPAPGVIDVQPEKIRVEVRIEDMRRMTTRTISRQLSGVLLPVSGSLVLTSLPASDVKIVVGGQYRSVNNLKEDRLRVIADVTGATGPGQFRAKVLVMDLPLGTLTMWSQMNWKSSCGGAERSIAASGTALKKGDNNQGQTMAVPRRRRRNKIA